MSLNTHTEGAGRPSPAQGEGSSCPVGSPGRDEMGQHGLGKDNENLENSLDTPSRLAHTLTVL